MVVLLGVDVRAASDAALSAQTGQEVSVLVGGDAHVSRNPFDTYSDDRSEMREKELNSLDQNPVLRRVPLPQHTAAGEDAVREDPEGVVGAGGGPS